MPDAPPAKVLFVCRENACRSQIAEALARRHGAGLLEPYSAGSAPRGSVDPGAKAVMAEQGLNLDRQRSKGIADLPPGAWDVVVGMGCGDACPQVQAKRHLEWEIPDPAGSDPATYRRVRDLIEARVWQLLTELAGKS